jgi:hypothetical protein
LRVGRSPLIVSQYLITIPEMSVCSNNEPAVRLSTVPMSDTARRTSMRDHHTQTKSRWVFKLPLELLPNILHYLGWHELFAVARINSRYECLLHDEMSRQLRRATSQDIRLDCIHDTALLLVTVLRIKGDHAQADPNVRRWLKMIMFYMRIVPASGLEPCTSTTEMIPKWHNQVWPWTREEHPRWEHFLHRIASCILAIVYSDLGDLEQGEFKEWFVTFHAVIAGRLQSIADAARSAG